MRFWEVIIEFFMKLFGKKKLQAPPTPAVKSEPEPSPSPKDLHEAIEASAAKAVEAADDWTPDEPEANPDVGIEKPKKPKEVVALDITAHFEGAGWGGTAGNFDGQGISAGVLQWNFGQGTLQNLLKHYIDLYSEIPEGVFPRDITKYAGLSPAEAVKLSQVMQNKQNRVLPAWQEAWDKFLSSPEGVQVQVDMAKPYFQKAASMAQAAGMKSRRAFCFFFDVAVQNGSMKGVKPGEPKPEYIQEIINGSGINKTIWEKEELGNEQKVLLALGWERAKLSHKKWVMDVFSRKGTIAVGTGVVHKQKMDFREDLI